MLLNDLTIASYSQIIVLVAGLCPKIVIESE